MVTNEDKTGSGTGVVWILRPSSIRIAMEVHVCGKLCTIETQFHVLGGLDVSEHMLCCFPVHVTGFCTEAAESTYCIGNVWMGSKHEVHQRAYDCEV